MEAAPKILIVDDEPFNVDYLEQELEDLGYQTISAAHGVEALDCLAEAHPDLVLLDIMMPVMDGFEVLRRMKAELAWRDTPVIIVSAMSDLESVVRGIELGAEDYLPKPFNPIILKARLNAGLNRKRLHDLEKKYTHSLERELEIGHQIQSGFLPGGLPELPGWEAAAHFQAAREVAGDFYDVFLLAGGKLGFFLGDVTDKGVGAALFMALYRSLLRAAMCAGLFEAEGSDPANCADLLEHAVHNTNKYVCQTHENALFATLFAGVLDLATGCLTYINAGHNPPIIFFDGTARLELTASGPLLGFLADLTYQASTAELYPGETLLVYSDGVEDTRNSDGAFFGKGGLTDAINGSARSGSGIVADISDHLNAFRGEEAPFDDITMLSITRQSG